MLKTTNQKSTELSAAPRSVALLPLLTLFLSLPVNAQNPPSDQVSVGQASSTLSLPAPSAVLRASRYGFGGTATIGTARTLSENEPESYSGVYRLALAATDKSQALSASLIVGYAREYSYQRDDGSDGDFENLALGLSKKWKRDEIFSSRWIESVSVSLGAGLPTSQESRRQTLLGSLGPGVSLLSQDLNGFSLEQSLRYSRRFYEFDIRDDGTVNSPDLFRSRTNLAYAVTDKLSLSLGLTLDLLLSFQGTSRSQESSTLALDYAVSKRASVSAGFGTERGTLDSDGQGNRLKFFDQEKAQAFLDLVLSI